ncbi:hypothetical protein BsWGS_22474 [Bradybaena similaris]
MEFPMKVLFSPRKCIPVGGKRKAENSNYRKEAKMKQALPVSNNLESDLFPMDRDTDFGGLNSQYSNNQLPENTVASDVQQHGCVLHNLIQSQSFSQAIKLLKEGDHFSQDDLDKALILACQIGHKYIVQKVINLGAHVQYRNTDGLTPLMICSRNGFVDLVKFLMKRQADVNAASLADETALILCIHSPSSANISKLLLEHTDINIDHQNAEGYTALMKAVEAFDFKTAYILLQHYFVRNKWQRQPWWKLHNETVNCKGETTAAMFSKFGFGKLLEFFEQYIEVKSGDLKKPFNLNITAWDIDLLNTFFDSACVSLRDKKSIAYEAFTKLFEHKMKGVKIFSNCEIMMVKRLMELGAKVEYSFPVRSPVSIATEAGSYALVDLLCQHGGNANEIDENRLNPLSIAAREDRLDLIELLLRHRADINNKNQYSYSALDTALRNGHVRCAKLLIQHGAVMDMSKALANAACSGMSGYVNFLLENYPHQMRQCLLDCKDTLLLAAVQGGNIEMISHVLEAGADVNEEYFHGHSSLATTALAESKNGDVARFLIERGANVNAAINIGDFKHTALWKILKSLQVNDLPGLELVRVLLKNGATNIYDDRLLLQRLDGGIALLQLLLDHGADLLGQDWKGNTALMISLRGKCPRIALFIINYAKGNKDFLNAHNRNGTTALMRAVKYRHATVVKELIAQGVDVNAKDRTGYTDLRYFFSGFYKRDQTDMDILTSLVNASSDINCCDRFGRTMLMQAARRCWNDALLVLLDAGADVNAASRRDNVILTPLSYVMDNLSSTTNAAVACISTLIDRGAHASYLLPVVLHRLILSRYADVMCTLIKHGFGPVTIKWSDIRTDEPFAVIGDVSPLCRALACGNISIATYFMEIMFLTKSDVSSLMYNYTLRSYLKSKNYWQCLNLLDEMSSQPMSLFRLAFVAVLSAVGTTPGRENRVKLLPLPQMLKDNLLFKSQAEDLPRVASMLRIGSIERDRYIVYVHKHCWDFSDSDDDSEAIYNVFKV